MSLVLAQSGGPESDVGSVLFWGLVLLGLLSLLFAAVSYLRKWMRAPDPRGGAGFTLSDLRQMRREGKISEAEFEKAKSIIVAATQRAMARDREASQKLEGNGQARGFDVVPPDPASRHHE
ncbi:MAG TPA: hypothetical protein VK324_14175 [Tepidisphaeraceae bacterium]|nr:hypothetical protein [Tepidisphaeraceae bacterium]